MFSRQVIEEIAVEKVCDAYFDVDYCQAGVHILQLDVWQAIQKGNCACTPFENDARTMRMYWNDHPIAAEVLQMPRRGIANSPLLSIAALSAVVLAFFVFGATKCVSVLHRRSLTARTVRRIGAPVQMEDTTDRTPTVVEMT